jgi:hypothetical protein
VMCRAHGGRRKHGDGDLDLTGLLEAERHGEGIAFLQRRFSGATSPISMTCRPPGCR